MTRHEAERRGRRGEQVAALWLRLKGWRIHDQRVRTPRGEVDLIARRGRTLAFIEVKTRARIIDAQLLLDAFALRRVASAVELLAPRYTRPSAAIRIDAIFCAPWQRPRHLENVWHG
ncbi:YraN family protein [Sphingomicrobium lutaoense]|uniref:Putative endonuclease n=1 Tax=Sphingomicrobium lutaoense TaxID=515949 RepID=A0A839Z315_9SPHN|nr:YraN family protein [Sphingomicrobium lutaoense]MBB3764012.1 putative endonuclease [Sphingomicrobium lutaoense]